ncbi:hypothetical protein [Comamonas squillarum]|uniref:Uncharacterized protein n=1 Tax=Comamonas squillarum TaxID=2977320 RepID=A0ABY6A328_9BURK|nr:hypothetical protein [Comamonas sp. PR12]UXC20061.1 hypothetical protein N4T19_08115 [Comamonas sp. PR12]
MAENNSSAPLKTAEGAAHCLPALTTNDELPEAVIDAVAAALGDTYDCLRVWSAWSYGTMGPDDFRLVAEDGERTAEIARAAIEAYVAATQAVAAQAAPAAVAVPDEREMVIQNVMKLVANWGITGHSGDFEVMFKAWVAIETALRAALAATPALPATEDSSAGDLAEPTDAEIVALNEGERFFSMSESRFGKEVNPHTQYHTGEPGYLQFARAVLARWGSASQAQPADALDAARLDFLETQKRREARDGGYSAFYSLHLPAMAAGPWQATHGGEYDHKSLREAIDAAMAAAQEGGKAANLKRS